MTQCCSPPRKTEQDRIQHGALKSREHKRINNLKILHFDSTDNELVQITKSFVDSFISALNLGGTITDEQILNALQQARIASDGYNNVTYAQEWNTTFEFQPLGGLGGTTND